MTSLFSYSPDELEELQCLFLTYVNKDFPNCNCGCRGFPINILTIEFNEREIDLESYNSCPARHERSSLKEYQEFKKDKIYKDFLIYVYPIHYGDRKRKKDKEREARVQVGYINHEARERAKRSGEKTFKGSPCVNGHEGVRFTRNNSCVDCENFKRSMRDAIKRGAFRERLSQSDKLAISEIYKRSRSLSEETGIEHHVDHIKPLAAGGRHHPKNLQILTATENLKKGSKFGKKTYKYSEREKILFADQKNRKKLEQVQKPEKKTSIFSRFFGP